jgi:HD-like signal output (HDOD) protein
VPISPTGRTASSGSGAVKAGGRGPATPEALVEELNRLPVHNTTALRVLSLLEDPDVPVGELSGLIQADPALAARILKLANSSFFARRNEVVIVEKAIMAIGLQTVRTFAVAAAFDLFNDHGAPVPGDFWHHAVATAAGATSLAREARASVGEAFSAGLLHDLGIALFHRLDPIRAQESGLLPGFEGPDQLAAERAAFGLDHAEAAGIALKACRFPKQLVEAVGGHHDPVKRKRLGKQDLTAIVALGERLGAVLAVDGACTDGEELAAVLQLVEMDDRGGDRLWRDVANTYLEVSSFLNA